MFNRVSLCFRWTGSNTNDRNNAGQGLAGTDRSNVVPLASSDDGPDLSFGNWRRSYPANISTANFLGFERQDLKNLALVRPSKDLYYLVFTHFKTAVTFRRHF